MPDLLMLALVLASFAATGGFVAVCTRLTQRDLQGEERRQ